MYLNIANFEKLINEKVNGNYHEFARQTGISVPTIFKIVNRQRNAGVKVISLFLKYLKINNIPFEDYIFLS